MRVLFIAPQPFFEDRGTPIRTLRQLEEVSRLGHHVDILCYPFGQPVERLGVRILRIPRPPGIRTVRIGPSAAKLMLDGLLFWKAFGLCLRHRYAVIQAVEEAAFFAVFLCRLFGCRLVYNMDSCISEQLAFSGFVRARPLLAFVRGLEKMTMRRAACVITVGPLHSDAVRAAAPRTRILQLEDAPPDVAFQEETERAQAIREEFGLEARARVCLYTGNFEPYQGVDLIVRAAGVVARHRSDVRFLFVGGSAEQIERMRTRAREEGAADVCLFAGRRPTGSIASFLTVADVLLTARHQGTNPPMKLYQYMQTGRPIVATRLPTHTQVLDETCAFLTQPNPESFARGILIALDDPQKARDVAACARKRVTEQYSRAIFGSKVRSLYRALEEEVRSRSRGAG